MYDVFAGIAAYHAGGVVHRRIRPESFIYANPSPYAALKLLPDLLANLYSPKQKDDDVHPFFFFYSLI